MKTFITATFLALALGVISHQRASAQAERQMQDRQQQNQRQDLGGQERPERAERLKRDQRREGYSQRERQDRRDQGERETLGRRRGGDDRLRANRQDDREPGRRASQRARRGRVTGEVVQTKRVDIRGSDRQHLVVLLKTDRGNRVPVDLGDVDRLGADAPRRGDEVRIDGRLVQIGDRRVLVGEQLHAQGKPSVRIEQRDPRRAAQRSDNQQRRQSQGGQRRQRQSGPDARPSRAGLGVALATDPAPNGVRVMRVMPGSPASEVGLRSGDVITRIDNRSVSTPQELMRLVIEKQPGEQVSVVVDRNGQRRSFDVRLAERQEALDPPSRGPNTQRRDSR